MTTQHSVETARFGKVEYEPSELVRFSDGVVGFPDVHDFLLLRHSESSPFHWLQSIDDGNLAFLLVDPAVFVEDYAPEMPDSIALELDLIEETPRLVYTIVTIPNGRTHEMTINLAGPIVVNVDTGRAKQIVLESDSYPIRHQVFAGDSSKGEKVA